MRRRVVTMIGGAIVALLMISHAKQVYAAQACADAASCAQVTIGSASGKAGEVQTVSLTFQQAPDNGVAGGPDETAALALTINLAPDGGGVPLTLADCNLNNDGLPGAVKPDESILNFKVVVENVSCANRTHCLCPDPESATIPDNFINLVIYGPNPLPTPSSDPIVIPTLPGPDPHVLLTIDLKIDPTASGTIPLHVFNEVQDSTHPQFTALLSVGDKLAVDQTCVPAVGAPPCSDPAVASQIAFTDGSIAVTGQPTPTPTPIVAGCCGDADQNASISTSEATNAVLALINRDVTKNPAADCGHDGNVSTADATRVIQNLVNRVCN